MGTHRMFTVAVLLGVGCLALSGLSEAAYKRDYGQQRGKKPAAEIGRNTRASYSSRQPDIPALYSAPKPQKLQQQPDQSLNDVDFSDQSATTTDLPFDQDQIVIDAADDGAETADQSEEGISEDYQFQGSATEKSAALQEDPSLNEFPEVTSPSLADDSSSYVRRKPVANSYELSHTNRKPFSPQQEQKRTQEDTSGQYLPPAQPPSSRQQQQPQQQPTKLNDMNVARNLNGPYQSSSQRKLLDQQQIETTPYQNHIQVQVVSPNPSQNQIQSRGNNVGEQNAPARQYLPQYEKKSEEESTGYNYSPPQQPQQPQQKPQQQHQRQSPSPFSLPASQNEIGGYASKGEGESLQLEGLSESIVDAELLQRVQQIIEEHEKQQKELLEKLRRENGNGFAQTSGQSTSGGYNEQNNDRGALAVQAQSSSSPLASSTYFSEGSGNVPSSRASSSTSGPTHRNFNSHNDNEQSFDQPRYFESQSQQQAPRNFQEPRHSQSQQTYANSNVNEIPYESFPSQPQHQRQQQNPNPQQTEPIFPSSRQFDFGGYAEPRDAQGHQPFSTQDTARSQPQFRDVTNSIFSQDEPQQTYSQGNYQNQQNNNNNQVQTDRQHEQRTSKLNNYAIDAQSPEGKSQPLSNDEPAIEYQKAVLSTHFVETQPDPDFQPQQQQQQQQQQQPNSREYLPPSPQARLHGAQQQFPSPAQLGAQNVETRAALNADQHTANDPFAFYQAAAKNTFPQPQIQPQPFFTAHHQQPQIPFVNSPDAEFASVNVNAGLVVESQAFGDGHVAAGDIIYGVPSSSLQLGRQETQQSPQNNQPEPAHYVNRNNQQQQPSEAYAVGRSESFFGQQSQSQYLPPSHNQQQQQQQQQQQTVPFRPVADHLQREEINAAPREAFPSHESPADNSRENNREIIIPTTSDRFSSQIQNGAYGENLIFPQDNAHSSTNSKIGSAFQSQSVFYEQQQQQQPENRQDSFFQGKPGASFVNNNVAFAPTTNENRNPLEAFGEGGQTGRDHHQQQQDTPRPIYGIPLAPVISLGSDEDLGANSNSDFSSAQQTSFFNNEPSPQQQQQHVQAFPSSPSESINNNYLAPQAHQLPLESGSAYPFNRFSGADSPPQQPLQVQSVVLQQPSAAYGISSPNHVGQTISNTNNNNNRNDEPNGYGNSRNGNSAHLEEIPAVSQTVSIPTRDYSSPTSFSYSRRVDGPLSQSPSRKTYNRIRKRLSSSN